MPANLAEALEMKTRQPDAVPMAGGTDLLVRWTEHPDNADRTYVDLSGLGELDAIRWDDDFLELGALTTYWDVLGDERAGREFAMLHQAAPQVGAIQIQARGTWAGNVANASPAADGVPVLMAYDGEVQLASAGGRRTVPLSSFYRGYKEMDLRPDELITAIRLPRRPWAFEQFIKIGPRRAQAIAKVGVALAHAADGWRVVAVSVAPTIRRCPSLERLLDDSVPVGGPADLLPAIDADVSPIDDIRSTAGYRRRVFARIIYYALVEVMASWT
jgi:CO/xanthine dehydrogenase FAD-binding subunit